MSNAVRHQRHLDGEALLVHLHARREFRHRLLQPRELRREPLGRPPLDRRGTRLERSEPTAELRGQRRALARPHGEQLPYRSLGDGLDLAPLRRGHAVLMRRQHLRLPRHEREVHLALELQALLELLGGGHELARPAQVHRDDAVALRRLGPPRRNRHMAALEQLPQPLTQRGLDPAQLERQL